MLDSFPPSSAARKLVDAFVSERLFVASGASTNAEATVTVAHEALLRVWPRAAAWVENNRDFLRVRARVEARMREHSPLLEDDPLLDSAKGHLALKAFDSPGDAQIRRFVEESVNQAEERFLRRERVRRNVMIGLALLTLTAAIGWVWAQIALGEKKEALQQIITERNEKTAALAGFNGLFRPFAVRATPGRGRQAMAMRSRECRGHDIVG